MDKENQGPEEKIQTNNMLVLNALRDSEAAKSMRPSTILALIASPEAVLG
jgi:hypothetical protein